MTLEDIARRANVSKSAVSLALNGKPGISAETRQRVLRIAEELGYIPRGMVKAEQYYGSPKTMRFLACVRSDVVSERFQSAPFFMELIHGVERQCRELGYALVFSAVKAENLEDELRRLETSHPVSGTILLGTNLNPEEVRTVADKVSALVVLDANFELLSLNCVVMNNVLGAYEAGSYLLELGHSKIGYIESRTRISNFEARKRGFLASLRERGLEVAEEDFIAVTPEIEKAEEEFKAAIAARDFKLPTALFCENDYLAIGVVKALKDSGFKVPDNVSVIGFDNIPQATIISPELTTIHVDKGKLGLLAVQRLARIIEEDDQTGIKVIVDTKLVRRESCRAVAPYNADSRTLSTARASGD